MNVASLELCQELYRHSRWNHTDYLWVAPPLSNSYEPMHNDELHRRNDDLALGGRSNKIHNSTFAYDLGYMLRKLPTPLLDEGVAYQFQLINTGEGFMAQYWHSDEEALGYEVAATPEDAVAAIAIELFQQGILTRDGDE